MLKIEYNCVNYNSLQNGTIFILLNVYKSLSYLNLLELLLNLNCDKTFNYILTIINKLFILTKLLMFYF